MDDGTNVHFGMGFSSTEVPCLHDFLFTLSSRSKKRTSANVLDGTKSLLRVDASSYWAVTRTDVGGHFCGITMGRGHEN